MNILYLCHWRVGESYADETMGTNNTDTNILTCATGVLVRAMLMKQWVLITQTQTYLCHWCLGESCADKTVGTNNMDMNTPTCATGVLVRAVLIKQ